MALGRVVKMVQLHAVRYGRGGGQRHGNGGWHNKRGKWTNAFVSLSSPP